MTIDHGTIEQFIEDEMNENDWFRPTDAESGKIQLDARRRLEQLEELRELNRQSLENYYDTLMDNIPRRKPLT
jgi:hypothetical protein